MRLSHSPGMPCTFLHYQCYCTVISSPHIHAQSDMFLTADFAPPYNGRIAPLCNERRALWQRVSLHRYSEPSASLRGGPCLIAKRRPSRGKARLGAVHCALYILTQRQPLGNAHLACVANQVHALCAKSEGRASVRQNAMSLDTGPLGSIQLAPGLFTRSPLPCFHILLCLLTLSVWSIVGSL